VPPPPIRRTTARVVPVNRDGEVLVLFGCDPKRPESPFWFTIGGATEADETLPQAGVRELREETGIEVTADQLVGPYASGVHEFSWGGHDIANESHFFAVRLDDVTVTFDGLDGLEVGTIWEARWWRPDELPTEALASPDLPERLAEAVRVVAT
jgi:8-oxo-dGTP pyrophosphatase MutT (NUDIX family)